MNCPLCGYTFVGKDACHGCGLSNNCRPVAGAIKGLRSLAGSQDSAQSARNFADMGLIRCPSCGYEFAESSRIVSFFTRLREWFKRKGKEKKKHDASSP